MSENIECRTVDGGQRIKDRGWRTEDGGQRMEDRE
jgi:hypothetical protein